MAMMGLHLPESFEASFELLLLFTSVQLQASQKQTTLLPFVLELS